MPEVAAAVEKESAEEPEALEEGELDEATILPAAKGRMDWALAEAGEEVH
jgi:hypothetical protein